MIIPLPNQISNKRWGIGTYERNTVEHPRISQNPMIDHDSINGKTIDFKPTTWRCIPMCEERLHRKLQPHLC